MHPHERDADFELRHEVVTVGTPAVATGFTKTVPGAERWRIMGLSFVLVTDANVADRLVRVEYLNAAGGVFFSVAQSIAVTAGLTRTLSFGVGMVPSGSLASLVLTAPLPPFKLVSGLGIRAAILGVQAGDQISAASLFVDQWPVRP